MPTLLHVNASPRGEASASLTLAREFLSTYLSLHAGVTVDTLNLFSEPLPEFGTAAAGAKIAVFTGQEQTAGQAEAWAAARNVFDRFAAADAYLFNVPQWNSGVPYALKHWIDLVTQPGWSFGFDPASGYHGLVTGRKAAVVYTSGVYAPGVPMEFGVDFHSTFFDDWLRFVGITDVSRVRLDAGALSPDPQGDLDKARVAAREVAEGF
jgi:FMN-dependent NADH-azoreductase